MVYMPSDVLGWRPCALSWLDRYLAESSTAALQQLGATAPDGEAAAAGGMLCEERSQLESPGSPTLPGFGSAGADSFNATRGSAAMAAVGGTVQCPEHLQALRSFLWGLFDRFAEPLLQWVASKGTLVMPASAATLAASVCTLLEVQLDSMAR